MTTKIYENTEELKESYYAQIFAEIDKAIKENISNTPVPIEKSKFYKEYLKIRMRWIGK